MKTLSSNKTNSTESPKTPGGISKSLLTPCRRVGLSRNWKKRGPSPFISPLSGANSSAEEKQENILRKRKECSSEEVEVTKRTCTTNKKKTEEDNSISCNTPKIVTDRIPNRSLVPRKKLKTLSEAKECSKVSEKISQCVSQLNDNSSSSCSTVNLEENLSNQIVNAKECLKEYENIPEISHNSSSSCNTENLQQKSIKCNLKVSKLSTKHSKNKILQLKSTANLESGLSDSSSYHDNKNLENTKDKTKFISKTLDDIVDIKENNPNDLTKECMVVIQKKIFKNFGLNITGEKDLKTKLTLNKISSQTLFDSDSDDVPLSSLNIKDNKLKVTNDNAEKTILDSQNSQKSLSINSVSETDDFVDKNKVSVQKLEHKTSTSSLKCKQKDKKDITKPKKGQNRPVLLLSSQSSNSSDDDFVCDKRKTILVKKTYNKGTKPFKSKSTGSISQKDIDEIKARIESKKNMLLAKAMVKETQELRDLIKKWQTGCQTALTELLELMKKRMPDQNMEYSELLQMLKIPADLVGYDSENDCFNTPDDTNIILSGLNFINL